MRRPKQFNLLSVKCIRRVGVLHSWMLCCHCQTLRCWLPILGLWSRSGSSSPFSVRATALGCGDRSTLSSPTHTERSWGQFYRYFWNRRKKSFLNILKQKCRQYSVIWIWMEFTSGNCTSVVKKIPKFLLCSRLLHHQTLPLPLWTS